MGPSAPSTRCATAISRRWSHPRPRSLVAWPSTHRVRLCAPALATRCSSTCGRCRRVNWSSHSPATRGPYHASRSVAAAQAVRSSRRAPGTRRCACGILCPPRRPSTRCSMAPTCSRSHSSPTVACSPPPPSTAPSRCGMPRRRRTLAPSTAERTWRAAVPRSPRRAPRTTPAGAAFAPSPSLQTAAPSSPPAPPSSPACTTCRSVRCCASTPSRTMHRSMACGSASIRPISPTRARPKASPSTKTATTEARRPRARPCGARSA
mmetsp:Transcript_71749/g.215659  ORF Transcript_71749/g.215659 Transcript_71749/m.215659 type:complete len:264 (-) Transcript_71749:40-831(-)